MTFGDFRRFRAWVLAAAVAIVGAQTLHSLGVVELGKSMYVTATFDWVGNIVGGLLFGFGMVFAGGCASRNLVRAGSGDLRSLVVLVVLGMFAYMAIGGILGPLRAELSRITAIDLAKLGLASGTLGDVFARYLGIARGQGAWIASAAVAGLAAVYCFKDGAFRISPPASASGCARLRDGR
jgi:hypothetical protein